MQDSNRSLTRFTPSDVKLLSKKTVFSGFFKMIKYQFSHRLFDGGWSEPIEREMFERGHAVAVLPYDPTTDQVVIVEQIRVGALEHRSPWQLEIVAGIIDEGETAEDVARREMLEEAGVEVGQLEKITAFYPSSGGCSEKLDVFVGEVDASKAFGTHGLEHEGEDIRVHVMSREEAYQGVQSGMFENGASIIALQWLELNHRDIVSKWRSK
ncbi:ADP-ribose diphosphatase [Vibrio genomosp. F10]|uniref:ADP-ribose pyrophosphatase n=1 Tax=Vibrio genomosp. F10 TaxID=723171 RepID=A0A1B9QZV9_9VIBR|nr:ADP-ribose diphosphatase [Vibrio genomosp. F10]OCH76777.1 ADP-ribose diphosphatase [Vibrio genomosp. F10]OEF07577.1 ADP-ribose diphosphatase [Vibrio genomosp. F10 str. 9ZD137]